MVAKIKFYSMQLKEKSFNRNSRLILSLSQSSFEKLSELKVCLYGLTSTGSEIIKNLVLMNVGTVDVYDDSITELKDIGSNFFTKPDDVGKSKLDSIVPKLQELCENCIIGKHTEEIDEDILKNYSAFIITKPISYSKLIRLSEFCHTKQILFIIAYSMGPFCGMFEDFSTDFEILNLDGKNPFKYAIDYISSPGSIFLRDPKIEIPSRTKVVVHKCDACPELNNKTFELQQKKDNSEICFSIGHKLGEYGIWNKNKQGGYIVEVKPTKTINHKTFAETLSYDFSGSNIIRDVFIRACKAIDGEQYDITTGSKELLDRLECTLQFENPILAGTIGGLAAHNAMMYQIQTYTPAEKQWVFVDFRTMLSEEIPVLTNTKYDPIISVIGNDLFNKLRKEMTFLIVGAGAVGCVYARDMSLIGPKKVIIFDHDEIEPSNLTRQFLYKDSTNGKKKADVACEAIKERNPDIEVESHTVLFKSSTAKDLDLSEISAVLSGVDTARGRNFCSYVARMLKVPFITCGAEKAFANGEIIFPYKTPLYRPMSPDKSNEIALSCTIRVHPTRSEHCAQWYKVIFDNHFFKFPMLMGKSQGIAGDEEDLLQMLEDRPTNISDCQMWARRLFEEQHVWNLPKNMEKDLKPAVFDPNEPLHATFIRAATKLQAQLFGIPFTPNDINDAPFKVPKTLQPPDLAEKAANIKARSEKDVYNRRCELSKGVKLHPIAYDKDDTTHLDFVYTMATIRCRVYNLPELERVEVMQISGMVDATIPTTGAVVSGLMDASLLYSMLPKPFHKSDSFYGYVSADLMTQVVERLKTCGPTVSYRTANKQRIKRNVWDPPTIEEDVAYDDLVSNLDKEWGDVYGYNVWFDGVLRDVSDTDSLRQKVAEVTEGNLPFDYIPLSIISDNPKIPEYLFRVKD